MLTARKVAKEQGLEKVGAAHSVGRVADPPSTEFIFKHKLLNKRVTQLKM